MAFMARRRLEMKCFEGMRYPEQTMRGQWLLFLKPTVLVLSECPRVRQGSRRLAYRSNETKFMLSRPAPQKGFMSRWLSTNSKLMLTIHFILYRQKGMRLLSRANSGSSLLNI